MMPDESKLIRRARDGDRDAFAALADRYRPLLYAAAYAVLRSREDAEDVAQEAVCRIYTKLHTFRASGSFGRWAYAIAKNAAIARLRSTSREVPLGDAEPAVQQDVQTAAEIRAAVDRLPDRLREPLVMYYINGYSGEEVADFLGRPQGTVRAQLTEARRALRKELVPMLKRTLQELVPPAELGGLLARLQVFPKLEPEIAVVEVDAERPDPDFVEGAWFFVPLRRGGVSFAGWYDYPGRNLTDVMFARVLGETEVEGERCFEVCCAGSARDGPDRYMLWYWSVGADAVNLVGKWFSWEERRSTRSDDDWDDYRQGMPRRPGRLPRLERAGDDEFVDAEPGMLSPVGVYDVSIGGVTHRCLRVIHPEPTLLVDAYLNAAGRTVLFRRYNAPPEYTEDNLGGTEWVGGAVERLAAAGTHRLVYNGTEFYHWYDCVTDVALVADA